MKTIIPSHMRTLAHTLCALLLSAALCSLPHSARAQLYVGGQSNGGTVGEYDATTGATINASFITGLNQPDSIVLSGDTLFAVNEGSGFGTVGTYNATTGAAINTSFITGLDAPAGVAVFGNNIFFAEHGPHNSVSEYNATTGALINANFITGLNNPWHLAISGNNLFVADEYNSRVGEYNAITGAAINPSFISGLSHPVGLAISGNNLFVGSLGSNIVGKFDVTTGAVIDANFITGLHDPFGLAVSSNRLYVVNGGNNTVGEYDATNGATINASFIVGANPVSLAVVPQIFVVPTPTSAPSISVFPAADQNFYGGVLQTLQNHGSEFSPSTQAFLSTTTTQLQPLINPSSDTALKKTASLLAFGAKTFGNGLDLASNFTDPGGFFLSGNTIGSLPNAISDVTKIWSLESVAVGQTGIDAPTTNFAPLDILNHKIGAITTLTSSAYAFSHGNVLSGLCSLNAFIYRDMIANQLEVFTHDPADPNFQTVYLPDMLRLPALPTTGNVPLDNALSREMQGLANTAQYLKAVNASFDKYAGAIAAGDNLHAALQMEAVLNYLALYNQASQDASVAVTDTQNLIAALGFVGSYDPQKLIAFQSQLAASGFSADVLAYYTGLGYTAADINNLKQDILNLNANSFSASMANVDAQTSANLLQGTTAAAPEPGTLAMLGIGLFSLGLRRRRV